MRCVVIVILACFCVAVEDNMAFAEGGAEGGGGGSGSTTASCADNALQSLCGPNGQENGDGSEGGGASWRLFKIIKNSDGTLDAYGLDDSIDYGGNILTAKPEEIAAGGLKQIALKKCKDYDWLISFGWDGMHNSHMGYPDFNFQIGPAGKEVDGKPQDIVKASPNPYNALTWDTLKKGSSSYKNNARISDVAAKNLYKLYQKASANPDWETAELMDDTAFFCFSPETTFEGNSAVYDSSDHLLGQTGYQSKKTTQEVVLTKDSGRTINATNVTVKVKDCPPTTGCGIKFKHYLKTTNGGSGKTGYYVDRRSNLKSKVGNLDEWGKNTFVGPDDNGKKVLESSVLTVVPGMRVCDILYFKPDDQSGTDNVFTKICINVEGNAQPDGSGPEGDDVFLNMKVKNGSVPTKYNNYQRSVYAKPYDTVEFRASYNPILQYTYNIKPKWIKIGSNGGLVKNSSDPLDTLGTLFNSKRNANEKWNNGYGVVSENFKSSAFSQSYISVLGATNSRFDSNWHNVDKNEVGSTLKETAKTNVATTNGGNNKTTPKQVTFLYDKSNSLGGIIDVGQYSSKAAEVYVPYNYKNDVSINVGNTMLYAGETSSVELTAKVNPKANSLTTDTGGDSEAYTTKVDNAKVRLITFSPGASADMGGSPSYGNADSDLCARYGANNGLCGVKAIKDGTLNENGNTNGYTLKDNASFVVPDLDAGSKICVAAAIYPATSGGDGNINTNGDGKWYISDAQCFAIHKKPSIQVWGGSVFSAGELEVPVAAKKHIYGYNTYDIASDKDTAIFGSFAELTLTSLGVNKGFASGAATGYAINNNGSLTPVYNPQDGSPNEMPPGGYTGGSWFCERSRLTLANTGKKDVLDCKDSTPGLGSSSQVGNDKDRSSLVSAFVNMSTTEAENRGVVVSTKPAGYEIHEEGESECSVGSEGCVVVGLKTTKVIIVKDGSGEYRDITIDRNIVYEDGYKSLDDVPKMIIYARNIKINCGVKRVDAVLITDEGGYVDTCADSKDENVDEKNRSNQLIINGTIISDKLKAKRTYGAAKGANSIVPAEIINYDTTLYLWGANKADSSDSGKMDASYVRELAPRR